jgi:hypothetical protein
VQVVAQNLGDIIENLRILTVDWQDDIARRVVERLRLLPVKAAYTEEDLKEILHGGVDLPKLSSARFDEGLLAIRLFLGLSDDQFGGALRDALGAGGYGIKRYRAEPAVYLAALVELGLLEAMVAETTRPLHWTDTVVERLRSGRGSAISGQRRGRNVEDFVEEVVKKVFDTYQTRVSFTGNRGITAKCDIAIPSKELPRIIIEAKGYGATGSKMTDISGDIGKIIEAKRPDTVFLFFTDGITWKQRMNDLRKIVALQNDGHITRVYTYAMAERFEADLRQLKVEFAL